jgi:hypothetical protein
MPANRVTLATVRSFWVVALVMSGCADAPPQIPDDQSAVCADGKTCRSILIGDTLIRGHAGQKLFSDLVTDDPDAFASEAALDAALKAAPSPAHLMEPYSVPRPPLPKLCPVAAGERSIQARHDRFQKGRGSLVCSADYDARYLIVLRADGSVSCVENNFSYSCV